MLQENVEVANRANDLFASGGIEAVLPRFASDVVAYPFPEWIEESEYRGRIGETRNFLTWRQALEAVGLQE